MAIKELVLVPAGRTASEVMNAIIALVNEGLR
jgi:hypothetical protein